MRKFSYAIRSNYINHLDNIRHDVVHSEFDGAGRIPSLDPWLRSTKKPLYIQTIKTFDLTDIMN